jgi:hypothetical protein
MLLLPFLIESISSGTVLIQFLLTLNCYMYEKYILPCKFIKSKWASLRPPKIHLLIHAIQMPCCIHPKQKRMTYELPWNG